MEKNRQKKILFVDHDSGISGATISMGYLIEKFIERGFSVGVLTNKDRDSGSYLVQLGAEIIPYSSSLLKSIVMTFHFTNNTRLLSAQWFKNLFKDFLSFINGMLLSVKIINKYNPDILYLNEYVTIQFALFAKLKSIPVVVHIRSMFIQQKPDGRRWLLKKILREIPAYNFAITELEAKQISGEEKKIDNIIVIPEFLNKSDFELLPVLPETRQKFGVSENENIVTFLGGISSIKGSIDFISSIEYLSEKFRNTKFIIAGKVCDYKKSSEIHAYYERCIKYAERPKIKPFLNIVGEIKNVNKLLSISDIVVSCATISHFSRPIIEAWAHKKAVIGTDIQHTRNIIENETNGILVPPSNPLELAKAIERLLTDKDLRVNIGRKGFEKAKSVYSGEINTAKIVNYCEDLIKVL